MSHLLDTNAWIAYLRGRHPGIRQRIIHDFGPSDLKLCSVVKAELLHGAYKSSHIPENLGLLSDLFQIYASLPFDDSAAEAYGRLRTNLEKTGNLIGPNDLMIASIALAHNLTLVTHNTREFNRVPNLHVEDWEAK
jgi:tRNA(fMet)-specific endonuclease VapC